MLVDAALDVGFLVVVVVVTLSTAVDLLVVVVDIAVVANLDVVATVVPTVVAAVVVAAGAPAVVAAGAPAVVERVVACVDVLVGRVVVATFEVELAVVVAMVSVVVVVILLVFTTFGGLGGSGGGLIHSTYVPSALTSFTNPCFDIVKVWLLASIKSTPKTPLLYPMMLNCIFFEALAFLSGQDTLTVFKRSNFSLGKNG